MAGARKQGPAIGLLSPAEARRRLTALIRELEAQPSLRIAIGVDEAQAVLVSPDLLTRLDTAARDPRPSESRKTARGKAGIDPPAPAPVDGDDAPSRNVKQLVKKVIKSVRE